VHRGGGNGLHDSEQGRKRNYFFSTKKGKRRSVKKTREEKRKGEKEVRWKRREMNCELI